MSSSSTPEQSLNAISFCYKIESSGSVPSSSSEASTSSIPTVLDTNLKPGV